MAPLGQPRQGLPVGHPAGVLLGRPRSGCRRVEVGRGERDVLRRARRVGPQTGDQLARDALPVLVAAEA